MTEALFTQISTILARVLKAKGVDRSVFKPEDRLYEDGIGLDSLDAATLAAMLDHEFNLDPYNSGEFPQTVAEIVEFYSAGKKS
ncbi:MAG: acyl carrier protein [Acidobacteriia bacterium]|nr:acyl carrier protein [Terriglobia bacterium]